MLKIQHFSSPYLPSTVGNTKEEEEGKKDNYKGSVEVGTLCLYCGIKLNKCILFSRSTKQGIVEMV